MDSPLSLASSRTSLLKVKALCKNFGAFEAIKNVSFSLFEGEKLAVIGPNGAGKSTCFNLIGGQLSPDQGHIHLGDMDLTGKPPPFIAKAGIGRSFQIAAAYASLTVEMAVQAAFLAIKGQAYHFIKPSHHYYREDTAALIEQVGLGALSQRLCAELAYGDVKRVELAMALAGNPRILLMDEPTAGMAVAERQSLMEHVVRLSQDRNIALLFTEHDMDVVFRHADRIIVLVRGQILVEGPPDRIAQDPEVRAVYLGEDPL